MRSLVEEALDIGRARERAQREIQRLHQWSGPASCLVLREAATGGREGDLPVVGESDIRPLRWLCRTAIDVDKNARALDELPQGRPTSGDPDEALRASVLRPRTPCLLGDFVHEEGFLRRVKSRRKSPGLLEGDNALLDLQVGTGTRREAQELPSACNIVGRHDPSKVGEMPELALHLVVGELSRSLCNVSNLADNFLYL